MSADRLKLSAALSDNAFTRPVIEGRAKAQAIDLTTTVLHGSEMFWRQLKYAEFDLSEMSISSLLIATARGDRTWLALPVFTMRKFFHTGILVRADAGIERPQDLAGKRVGVPEYQQTSAIWSRGILSDQFGVKPEQIEWFMERGADRSHGALTGFTPPAGIKLNQIPASSNIGSMLLDGTLDATLLYLNDRNLVDRSTANLDAEPLVRPMFADQAGEARRYLEATGLAPMNHLVVVRRSIAERHPWVALNLFAAFSAAKREVRQSALADRGFQLEAGLIDVENRATLDRDFMAYGYRGAERELATIARYVHEQGLTEYQVDIKDIMVPALLDT